MRSALSCAEFRPNAWLWRAATRTAARRCWPLLAVGLLACAAGRFALADEAPLPDEDWPPAQQMIGPVAVLPVAPHIYMLTVDGINVGLQTGPDGAVVVNAGPASGSAALLAAIKQLSDTPIRYVVDTSGDAQLVGGDPTLVEAGRSLMQNPLSRPPGSAVNAYVGRYALIIARETLLARMVSEQQPGYPTWALPTETFNRPEYDFFLNREPISVIWDPAAHSSDDTVVRFQRSDVVVAGEIFDATAFPVIDVAHGGSIQGEIDALNGLLNRLTFTPSPIVNNTGGTLVIPVRGPVSDQQDVLWYRDMVGSMRDRVQDLMDSGMSLNQILAADPAQGYKARFGADRSGASADQFVKAIYQSLLQQRRDARKK